MAVKILPKEDATNGWSRILPPREPHACAQGRRARRLAGGGRGLRRPGRGAQARREPARRSHRPAGRARGRRRRLRAQLGLRHRPAAQRRRRVRGAFRRTRLHPPQPRGDRLSRHLRERRTGSSAPIPIAASTTPPAPTSGARKSWSPSRARSIRARRALSLGRCRQTSSESLARLIIHRLSTRRAGGS